MGSLILDLGNKKVKLPQQLIKIKEKGFLSAQYSFKHIKKILTKNELCLKNHNIYDKLSK